MKLVIIGGDAAGMRWGCGRHECCEPCKKETT
jgi:hypothetical protein